MQESDRSSKVRHREGLPEWPFAGINVDPIYPSEKKMALTCGDPTRLIAHIENSYPKAVKTGPNAIKTIKFDFPDKLVVNVFANGTVNFQGQASEISDEITAQVGIINRS
ncbi:hypothetical protein [Pseudomonas sp. A-RE-23]|uniref:hypothetical protein n=2 Tax=Pseudomonas TaxID=286 RepID=UPI001CBC1BFB|nr:hypothetical protein [Pseudomonas sp. A-RE-23]